MGGIVGMTLVVYDNQPFLHQILYIISQPQTTDGRLEISNIILEELLLSSFCHPRWRRECQSLARRAGKSVRALSPELGRNPPGQFSAKLHRSAISMRRRNKYGLFFNGTCETCELTPLAARMAKLAEMQRLVRGALPWFSIRSIPGLPDTPVLRSSRRAGGRCSTV
jgi:hypothetical protein